MVRPRVDLQLRDLLPCETVLREHSLDGHPNDLRGPTVELLPERSASQTARVVRVPEVALLVELVPGDLDLLRIHDDHEVARVDVRRELRLPLSAKRVGDPGRQPA